MVKKNIVLYTHTSQCLRITEKSLLSSTYTKIPKLLLELIVDFWLSKRSNMNIQMWDIFFADFQTLWFVFLDVIWDFNITFKKRI